MFVVDVCGDGKEFDVAGVENLASLGMGFCVGSAYVMGGLIDKIEGCALPCILRCQEWQHG